MKALPNRFIFQEAENILHQGGTVKLRLIGNSMFPLLHSDIDTVVIVPVSKKKLQRGTIVLFRYGKQYILHRIINKQNNIFQICGDGICIQKETATSENIIGILDRIEHTNGQITYCCSWNWRIKSEIWMLLRPMRRYLLGIYRRIKKDN